MKRVRKPLPVSLRRVIIQRGKTSKRDFHLVACTKAVKVIHRWSGVYLGNAYFNGKEFYFSRGLANTISSKFNYHSYLEFERNLSEFLSDCLFASGVNRK